MFARINRIYQARQPSSLLVFRSFMSLVSHFISVESRNAKSLEGVMSAKRSPAFVWLGVAFVIIVLVAAAPLISVLIAGGIADALGCPVNEGGAQPCPFMGVDLGEALVFMLVLGWLSMATLPFGAIALAVWLVIASAVAFVRWRRQRHEKSGH
jgi:hypothetical protein